MSCPAPVPSGPDSSQEAEKHPIGIWPQVQCSDRHTCHVERSSIPSFEMTLS